MRQIPRTIFLAFAIALLTTITLTGCGQQSSEGERMGNSSNSSPKNSNTKPTSSSSEDQLPEQKMTLPSFTLLKDSSYEDAGTAKVIWEILVPADVTKESLTNLLNDLYLQALSKKFQQHNQATVIDIKAYMSKQHADSGMGQWVGWISKAGGQTQPTLSIADRQIDQLGKKTEEEHGSQKTNEKKYGKRQFAQRIEPTEKPNKRIPNQSHKTALLTWQPSRKGTN